MGTSFDECASTSDLITRTRTSNYILLCDKKGT